MSILDTIARARAMTRTPGQDAELSSRGIPFWKACTAVPRVTSETWRASGAAARWLIASRAPVLVMTFSSAALGGVLALLDGRFDAVAWLACTVGLLLAHAANNQLNDLTDSALGIDRGNYFRNRYGTHVLEDGLLTRTQLLASVAITASAALAIGVWLTLQIGPAVVWPLCGGAFFMLFYTWPLKRLGLGEIAVWLVWGPLMTGGSYLAAAGTSSTSAAAIGAVAALAPTAVIFGKHIDKLAFDREKGVLTMPVRLGTARSRGVAIAIIALPYLCIPVLAAFGILPWTALFVMFALRDAARAIHVYRAPAPTQCPPGYPDDVWPLWYSAYAFAHARGFGLLLLAGLITARLFSAP